MKYAYENLNPDQFEALIVLVCQKLFGVSVQGFTNGKDGGRDAKFVGQAEIFPSTSSPWSGITIIQAKHTNGFNKTFTDPDFFSKNNSSSVIHEEIPRIKKLKSEKTLDNYILFSNRRMSGNGEEGM